MSREPAHTVEWRTLRMLFISLLLIGCKPKDNLDEQPNYHTQEPAEFFNDGASQRPLVAGTVPRAATQSPGVPYVAVQSPGPVGYPATAPAQTPFPFAITSSLLRRGQERYDIYCAVCHARTGDGDGMIVERGFPQPPSFYSSNLIHAPDSHFFNVITEGHGAMFSYNDRVAPDDRWAITAYIRVLQASGQSSAATRPGPTTQETQAR